MNTVVYGNQENEAAYEDKGLEKSIQEKQKAFNLISFSDDEIELEIRDVPDKSYISFLIPYDKDWNIYIDGIKTNSEKVNISLLGVRVNGGTHKVRLVYKPSMYYLGIMISASVCLFMAFVLLIFRWKRCSVAQLISLIYEKTNKIQYPSITIDFGNQSKAVIGRASCRERV